MPNDSSIWQLYQQTLTEWAQVASGELLSITAINTFSDLGSADPGIRNWSIYQLGNAIPAPTPSYSPHSDLFSAYGVYLDYLLSSAPPLHPAVPGTSPAIPVAPLPMALEQYRLASLQQPTAVNMAANAAQASALFCPSYRLDNWDQTLPTWRNSTAVLKGPRAYQRLLHRARIRVSPVPQPALPGQTLGGAQWPPFIERHPNTSLQSTSPPTGDTWVEMDLSVEQFGRFPLSPGAWFNPALFDPGRYPLPATAPDFFSANGAIGLLPKGALVGFRPNMTLTAHSLAQAQDLASNVIRIGPFHVQATAVITGAGTGEVTVHFAAQDSDIPVLLGVLSQPPLPTS